MKRAEMVSRLDRDDRPWDMLVIGGGATGVGVAVDAASRGYRCVLLEQSDFGKGTSSRSTKLVHGGVRYLQQGNISLVMEALKERGILRDNAPHLVHDLRFIVPNYDWWEGPWYGIGLKLYDMLAGKYGFGPSRRLSPDKALQAIPTLQRQGLRGGVQYYDGQFDDARLLISLCQTAAEQGATLINYMPVVRLTRNGEGMINGAVARDLETQREVMLPAKVVINATGPFADDVRQLDNAHAKRIIAPSQGVHLVLDRRFLPGDAAIMVPHTADGRVMFALPWHGHVVVGTTDTPIAAVDLEPAPLEKEIDFILDTARPYLAEPPTRTDVLSAFAGIRPLVKAGETGSTAALSRDHTIDITQSGLLTVCGGKWTTYRHMAEDVVDHAATLARLDERPCVTRQLRIHGHHRQAADFAELRVYGSDAPAIRDLQRHEPHLAARIHDALPCTMSQIAWACRTEMARTVDDALARRTRLLLLNAQAAHDSAPKVAKLMASELDRDEAWQHEQVTTFQALAKRYIVNASA